MLNTWENSQQNGLLYAREIPQVEERKTWKLCTTCHGFGEETVYVVHPMAKGCEMTRIPCTNPNCINGEVLS